MIVNEFRLKISLNAIFYNQNKKELLVSLVIHMKFYEKFIISEENHKIQPKPQLETDNNNKFSISYNKILIYVRIAYISFGINFINLLRILHFASGFFHYSRDRPKPFCRG